MPNIRDLRKRIRTIENIKRITSAMEKIAAARLFRAKASLANSRPYLETLRGVAGDLLNSQPDLSHPLAEKNETGEVLVILVTSDRGFCGAYNTNAIQAAVKVADKVGGKAVKFMVFGKKGAEFLRRRNYRVITSYVGLPPVFSEDYAEGVAGKVTELYRSKAISEAYLAFTEFVSIARHVPRVKTLLPVERLPQAGRNYMNYSYEPRPQVIIDSILPVLIETEIRAALVESAVSEHAQRMFVMQRATKSTDDVIAALTLIMNKARQTMITRELTDIVGAAETIA